MTVRKHIEIAAMLLASAALGAVAATLRRIAKRRDFGGVAGIDADRYRAHLARKDRP